MDSIPFHLLNDILLRVDLKSVVMMRCTNKSLRSHISEDRDFRSDFFSRFKSGLLRISTYRAGLLCYYSYGDSRPPKTKTILKESQILGSCSGLLLLSVYGLCVVNPLTKKFRFLTKPRSRLLHSRLPIVLGHETMYIGFAVHQIDRTTQGFKIVCITEVQNLDETTTYRFEINAGDSWRFSKTKITCSTSDLDNNGMRKPVYLDGSLHWLRKDGSIVAFNPETEQARLILTKFPQELSLKTLFALGDNSLTLISAFKEVIDVYALENVLTDPKWVLVWCIPNEVLDQKSLIRWNVEAYDGKCLVLRKGSYSRTLYGYDLRANKWELMGSIPACCNANGDFFQFTPSSSSSVIGLDKKDEEVLACDDKRISSLNSIMGLIIDGISSEYMEERVRKRSVEEDKKKPILLETMMNPSLTDHVGRFNNKRRRVE